MDLFHPPVKPTRDLITKHPSESYHFELNSSPVDKNRESSFLWNFRMKLQVLTYLIYLTKYSFTFFLFFVSHLSHNAVINMFSINNPQNIP